MNLEQIDQRVSQLQQEASVAIVRAKDERRSFRQARAHLRNAQEAQGIIQKTAQVIQQQAHAQIAQVVTTCLHSVFGEDSYDFQIRFERKRGKTEAVLVFLKDGHEIPSPTDEDSGGVIDVAAFALRLACLVLSQPRLRRLLVLDEPFRFVSAEYRPAIRSLLEKLAEDFKVQFIIVTHQQEYLTGKVMQL